MFPLFVGDRWVNLSQPPKELTPLSFATWAVVNGDKRHLPLDALASDGFSKQELSMLPINQPIDPYMAVAMLNWRRLSGAWPVLESSFYVSPPVSPDLVILRLTALTLIEILRELQARIDAGTLPCVLSDDPVPPPPLIDPALDEFYTLWNIDRDDARQYALDLYRRRD